MTLETLSLFVKIIQKKGDISFKTSVAHAVIDVLNQQIPIKDNKERKAREMKFLEECGLVIKS